MTRYRPQHVPKPIKDAIRQRYAWPGGYPLYLITSDCAALCVACGRKEYRQIAWDYHQGCETGWRAEAVAINWEDPNLYCDHCSERIASAYAEPEEAQP